MLASCAGSADKQVKTYLESYMDYDLLPVNVERLTGYVNPDGELAIEFDGKGDYQVSVEPFFDGLALTSRGFINREGDVVIEISDYRRDYSNGFNEGMALMYDEETKETVAIDKSGNELFRTDGKPINRMYGGYALIKTESPTRNYVVNRKGDEAFKLDPDEDAHISWIRSAARPSVFTVMSGKKLSYFIDLDSGTKYLEGFNDSEQNNAVVVDWNNQVVLYDEGEKKYGVADLEGNWVIQPEYGFMRCDGELYLVVADDGNVGWVDKSGKVVIEPQFESCRWLYIIDTTYAFNGSDLAYITAERCFINRKGERVYEDVPGDVESFGVNGRYILDKGGRQNWMTLPDFDFVPLCPSGYTLRSIFPHPNYCY